MNINRDYLIINDVKKSNVKLDNGSITFHITDKNTQNIFVNLVINISNNPLIQKYANIENAEDYTLTMNIVKPDNDYKIIEGKLHDKDNAIFEFDLPDYCCDKVGSYRCELLTKCYINNREEITTSNRLTYKVKSSVLNDLDEMVEAPEYPLVIQLFDKLSYINQYEEDRRTNELARQLAEEQRQAKHDELVSDMTDRVTAMDNKMVDVENRVSAKEQAVDKLIVDTKADIDEYKALKDTEINNAIAAQDNKINAQNSRLDIVENKNTQQDNRLDITEAKNVEQDNRLNDIEAIDVAQNTRLDAIEVKNQQQDDRLLDIEKTNKRQDMNLKCLFAESKNNMIDVTEEGNSIYLQNSTIGYTLIDEIKGNTLVNCNKEPDKELILNGNINTSGDNTVTITEGVDGGKVDVTLEGNTLVNVSKTKDSTAVTKTYTVENSGNHIALQGDVDGSCRPVITGNTLWIDNATEEVLTAFDETKNLRLQSSFEDNLVTQEMIDNGEEVADNLGKYRVDYKVTGKNKFDINTMKSKWWIESNGIIKGDLKDFYSILVPIKNNCSYTLSCNVNLDRCWYALLDSDYNGIFIFDKKANKTIINNIGAKYLLWYLSSTGITENYNIQVEEDTEATPYEPYKEYTKTLYLNSPLLEGDTIEEKDGGIYHVHNANKVTYDGSDDEGWVLNATYDDGGAQFVRVISASKKPSSMKVICDKLPYKGELNKGEDGIWIFNTQNLIINSSSIQDINTFKAWLQSNPLTAVYKLKTPTYELIEQSNLVIPSYANGHLDFNTAIPVEKVEFKPFSEELTYLYPSTSYTVQFISTKAILADLILGGTLLLSQSIVAGLNRISITTPETLVDNKLVINGVGANISEVVVTDTNREFGYFEGMKSVGECKGNVIEIVSQNKNLFNGKLYSGWVSDNGVVNLQNLGSSNNILTDYIKVEKNKTYINNFKFTYVWTFDENKKFIELVGEYGDLRPKNVRNATYAIFGRSIQNKDIPSVDTATVQIEEGSVATDYIPHAHNTQTLTHEPLRAVEDIKDKYVLIDGKWYIERNTDKVVFNGTEAWSVTGGGGHDTRNTFEVALPNTKYTTYNAATPAISPNYKNIITRQIPEEDNAFRLSANNQNYGYFLFTPSTSIIPYRNGQAWKTWLSNNPITVIYPLATPTYEPIDYNPFTVYSDITHISNNSTIPCNMTIKNTGYNCLLKPSTTYTVSSNLGLNVVTTPSTLTEDCLRFYDTDTSDVTTMKNVLVLEGDWTTKADLIPANFSGIESCFEQELITDENNEHYGKYKVNVKVANEDKSKENNITFYINEPLRGIGDIKDRVFVRDDKVVVQRNCGIRPYADGDFGTYLTDKVNTVYPLAEPIYEEVEYNDTKLFIESFKNSTLFYNSNVPVTSKLYYSYSVPLVDTVAQTASISDEQDSMIIDLATQVSVLEMMTL